MNDYLTPIALTMGEPAGIGAEISLKAWRDHRDKLRPFFLIDDPIRLQQILESLGWNIKIGVINEPHDTLNCFFELFPVLPIEQRVKTVFGRPDPANGNAVTCSIDRAVTLALSHEVAAIVTNPINKSVLYQTGFRFPGHTEYLGSLVNQTTKPVMMLTSDKLKVVAITGHVSIVEAVAQLSSQLIIETAQITRLSLKRYFGIEEPRMAITGLNPHAGEASAMGEEEEKIIKPAIETLKTMGHNVRGPLPADTLFHKGSRVQYDVALCMYHDQALIPIKTLDFEKAVNVTLGLPFIRTSPDHGTALDIAGTGTATDSSLVAALKLASSMAHCDISKGEGEEI